MELSIPIVVDRCTEVESSERKSTGGGSKKTSKAEKKTSAAGGDVDVQQCFDAYLHPESLEGDNQFSP